MYVLKTSKKIKIFVRKSFKKIKLMSPYVPDTGATAHMAAKTKITLIILFVLKVRSRLTYVVFFIKDFFSLNVLNFCNNLKLSLGWI